MGLRLSVIVSSCGSGTPIATEVDLPERKLAGALIPAAIAQPRKEASIVVPIVKDLQQAVNSLQLLSS
jgi:hypothetical protein